MHIVKVIKGFHTAIDEKTNKPVFGMRPRVGGKIRLNDNDYTLCAKYGLVEKVGPQELKKK